MSSLSPRAGPSRIGAWMVWSSLGAAIGWMGFRILVGLDFTDEMQYYGQIAALVRTGRFFQDDLFIQQLGYFFLLPAFRMHAAIFPNQDYLVLFGRLVLAAGYGAAGWIFWRATGRSGAYSLAARGAGLAMLLAWIPFQLFAPSYNTLSYLLVVGLAALWFTRGADGGRGGLVAIAGGLAALTLVYPPAGVVLSGLLVLLVARAEGRRAAGWLIGLLVLGHGLVLAGIAGLHGDGFWADARMSVEFSRAYGVAREIRQPSQWVSLVVLVAAGAVFWRWTGPARPAGPRIAARWIWLLVAGLAGMALLLAGWSDYWVVWGFAPMAVTLLLLTLLGGWIGGSRDPAGSGGAEAPVLGRAARAVWVGGVAVVVVRGLAWNTGYFATCGFLLLLAGLATGRRTTMGGRWGDLLLIGVIMGTVYGWTSGNGLHNFGVGAAGVLPFLVMAGAQRSEAGCEGARWALLPWAVLPVLVVINGMRHPYREERGIVGFWAVDGVPAFRGLRASTDKIETIERFRPLLAAGRLQGRRLLVVGPQPWFYFAAQARPATPMVFMHFDGNAAADDLVARRLFHGGDPDAILLTANMPAPIQQRVVAWLEGGATVRSVDLPVEFRQTHEFLTHYPMHSQITLLERGTKGP